MQSNKNKKKINLSYEEAILRLEQITGILNNPDTKIEQMLEIYQEGQQLLVHCSKILDNIEQKVEIINDKD